MPNQTVNIQQLVQTYAEHSRAYKAKSTKELGIRLELIDGFWRALGWDVGDRERRGPIESEVVVEENIEGWFDRINEFAKKAGVAPAHYIISSGNKETIEGTSIAKHFTKIFASSFRYNASGVAAWPALAVNYTSSGSTKA